MWTETIRNAKERYGSTNNMNSKGVGVGGWHEIARNVGGGARGSPWMRSRRRAAWHSLGLARLLRDHRSKATQSNARSLVIWWQVAHSRGSVLRSLTSCTAYCWNDVGGQVGGSHAASSLTRLETPAQVLLHLGRGACAFHARSMPVVHESASLCLASGHRRR